MDDCTNNKLMISAGRARDTLLHRIARFMKHLPVAVATVGMGKGPATGCPSSTRRPEDHGPPFLLRKKEHAVKPNSTAHRPDTYICETTTTALVMPARAGGTNAARTGRPLPRAGTAPDKLLRTVHLQEQLCLGLGDHPPP